MNEKHNAFDIVMLRMWYMINESRRTHLVVQGETNDTWQAVAGIPSLAG